MRHSPSLETGAVVEHLWARYDLQSSLLTVKIGFLVDKVAPEYVGGYEARLWAFALGLARHHEVRIYTSTPGSEKVPDSNPLKVPCHPLLERRKVAGRSLAHSVLFSVGVLADPLGGWRPDVFIVEAIPYLHLYSLRRWILRLSCPKVLDVAEAWSGYVPSNGPLARPSAWLSHRLLSIGLQWSDRAFAPSHVTARSLTVNYGCNTVDVVPMGIPSVKKDSDLEARQEAASYDFVTLGRLSTEKRHADFLRALSVLKSQGWRGRALVIGTGPLAGSLVDLARRLDLAGQVDFCGFVSPETKLDLLSKSRVYVLCSEREGQSIATLEALSCGLPAVVAKPPQAEVFGVSELVWDGENGLYYPVGDIGRLSSCMHLLLSDAPLRLRLSESSIVTACRFDWNKILDSLERRLLDIVC